MEELRKQFAKTTKESIDIAGVTLAGIELRNNQRKLGNLDGDIESIPYTDAQIQMIEEYTKLLAQEERIVMEEYNIAPTNALDTLYDMIKD